MTIRLAEALLKTAERRSSDMVESSDDEIQRGLTVRQSGSHVRMRFRARAGCGCFQLVILVL